jgi:hypothetical protein
MWLGVSLGLHWAADMRTIFVVIALAANWLVGVFDARVMVVPQSDRELDEYG